MRWVVQVRSRDPTTDRPDHGDLKPDNILCFLDASQRGAPIRLVITDVGIARKHGDSGRRRAIRETFPWRSASTFGLSTWQSLTGDAPKEQHSGNYTSTSRRGCSSSKSRAYTGFGKRRRARRRRLRPKFLPRQVPRQVRSGRSGPGAAKMPSCPPAQRAPSRGRPPSQQPTVPRPRRP